MSLATMARASGPLESSPFADELRFAAVANVSAAHTWTAYAEILDAAPFDADAVLLHMQQNPPINIDQYVWEIAVGSSGNERPIIQAHMVVGGATPAFRDRSLWLPFTVKRGERLAARQRNSSGTNGSDDPTRFGVALIPRSGPWPVGCRSAQTMGLTLSGSESGGLVIEASTSANAFGAWFELGTTEFPWRFLYISAHRNGANGAFLRKTVQVGWGETSGDIRVVAEMSVRDWSARMTSPFSGPYPVPIPAGQKVWARSRCSASSAATRFTAVWLSGLG